MHCEEGSQDFSIFQSAYQSFLGYCVSLLSSQCEVLGILSFGVLNLGHGPGRQTNVQSPLLLSTLELSFWSRA